MLILKTLYIYISNLGIFFSGLVTSFFKAIFKVFTAKNKSRNNKKSGKKLILSFTAVIIVVALVISATVFLNKSSAGISAVSIELNGRLLGYTESFEEAQYAQNLALSETGSASSLNLEIKETKTDACNIKSAEDIYEILMASAFPEYEKTTFLYIDGEKLCAVKSVDDAKNVLDGYLKECEALYPNASVSFSRSVSFKTGYAQANKTTKKSGDDLKLTLKTTGALTPQHVECEKTLNTVGFDTVEIETNTLFVGDSRIRRDGKNGKEYSIDIVTYNGAQKVLSQHLTSLSVEEPTSKIIERGMRAESLSMGNYTVTQTSGSFVWPVVGLYQVTSGFGLRSLGNHKGIDISGASATGSLVVAGASGVVKDTGYSPSGYGNYVQIDHGNGVETLYAHMLNNSIMVAAGDTVYKGQAIGRVGNTGYSFGAHLHFEVRINGIQMNPARYLGLE